MREAGEKPAVSMRRSHILIAVGGTVFKEGSSPSLLLYSFI